MPRRVSLPLKAAFLTAFITLFPIGIVAAQDFPSKPIRMIIPFPPGGGSDVTGRAVAAALGDRLGRQVIVDNRAGAGGVIGSELAANAPKDGYTLLMVSLAHTVNPWLYDLKGRYDPIKSFVPVAMIAASPVVMVVNPNVPIASVAELVALAKKQPGKLQYASAGIGSVTHLAAELFKYSAKIDMLHVPFKGAGPATIDVVGGHTSLMFGGLVATAPQIRSGKLRAIGMGSLKRNPVFPEVPAIAEAGVPGYETVNWFGLVAPAGTPAAIVDRLNAATARAVAAPDVRERYAALNLDPVSSTPQEYAAYLRAEVGRWRKVVTSAKLPPQ